MLDPSAGLSIRGEPDTIFTVFTVFTVFTGITLVTLVALGAISDIVSFAIGGGELPSTRLS